MTEKHRGRDYHLCIFFCDILQGKCTCLYVCESGQFATPFPGPRNTSNLKASVQLLLTSPRISQTCAQHDAPKVTGKGAGAGPLGGLNFGAANSAVFEPKPVLSSLLHAIPAHKRQAFSAERSISENHDLHRQLSCRRDQREENGHNTFAIKEPGKSLKSKASPTWPALRLKVTSLSPTMKDPSVTSDHTEEIR